MSAKKKSAKKTAAKKSAPIATQSHHHDPELIKKESEDLAAKQKAERDKDNEARKNERVVNSSRRMKTEEEIQKATAEMKKKQIQQKKDRLKNVTQVTVKSVTPPGNESRTEKALKGVAGVAKILDAVSEKGFINTSEAKELTQLSDKAIRVLLNRMKVSKLLRRAVYRSEKNVPAHRWYPGNHVIYRTS